MITIHVRHLPTVAYPPNLVCREGSREGHACDAAKEIAPQVCGESTGRGGPVNACQKRQRGGAEGGDLPVLGGLGETQFEDRILCLAGNVLCTLCSKEGNNARRKADSNSKMRSPLAHGKPHDDGLLGGNSLLRWVNQEKQ